VRRGAASRCCICLRSGSRVHQVRDALTPLHLTLLRSSLPLVGRTLALVGQVLAAIGDAIPLVG
jgi:hypothetical protein